MQVDVQIGCGAKALDEGDGAGSGFAALDACLLDEESIDDTMDDLQHRCQ